MTIDAHALRQASHHDATDPIGPVVDTALLEQLVMRAFGLDLPTLVSDRRGQAPVAFARQVAIYLSHVHLRMSISAAARRFRRDRTTAAHACRLVEDRRDDPDVDRRIEAVALALDHWRIATAAGGVTMVRP
jgi:chromosomal replication initiation ATPase DnaA